MKYMKQVLSRVIRAFAGRWSPFVNMLHSVANGPSNPSNIVNFHHWQPIPMGHGQSYPISMTNNGQQWIKGNGRQIPPTLSVLLPTGPPCVTIYRQLPFCRALHSIKKLCFDSQPFGLSVSLSLWVSCGTLPYAGLKMVQKSSKKNNNNVLSSSISG
jgi:hypothetical protein